jgi:hypothetical protein
LNVNKAYNDAELEARLTQPLRWKLYETELRARDIADKLEAIIDSYE